MEIISSSLIPPDKPEIIWTITTRCNYNCSYCCAKEPLKKKWNTTETSFEEVKIIVSSLKTFPGEYTLTLLGGEPLLWTDFERKVEYISEELKNKATILIITNGTIDRIESLSKINERTRNIRMNFSWHAESVITDMFMEQVDKSLFSGLPTNLSFMPHPDKKFIHKMKDAFLQLKNRKFNTFTVPYITGTREYDTEVVDWIREEVLDRVTLENKYITREKEEFEFDLIKEKKNDFFGLKCKTDVWKISEDMFLTKLCLPLSPIDLTERKDLSFIKSFDISCKSHYCTCDAQLRAIKYRKEP